MWKIHSYKYALIALALVTLPANAAAENVYNLNQNQTGINLPGVTLPQGHDEVRAADGTTCRSAVGGNGAYMDIGVLGNQATSTVESNATDYGRLVIPFGTVKKRVDCGRLYDLEVERLKLEIRMLKMGLGASPQQASAKDQFSQGWSNGSN